MSGPHTDFSGPYEASATSAAGPLVPRRPVVHIDSEGYTEIRDSRECSPGVESRPPELASVILSEETAAEAIRAGLDPLEVEALFAEADAAREEEEVLRREEADRAVALRLVEEDDRGLGEAYAAFAVMIDRKYGERRGFDFEAYLGENPYERAPPRSFRIAVPSRWTLNQIPSTVTLADIAGYRGRYHIPSDVHLYVPQNYERADQAPDGLVAVDELIMEAGFRFPLHYAVSYLLDSWNLAPLQLTSNAWLMILCTYALFGKYKLHRLLTAAETNFLYKLANARRTIGFHHLQPRLGRVVFGVPNRVHGDPGKWFWVGGSWKAFPCDHPSTSQCPPVELEIPTDFRIRNPSPRIPSVSQLSDRRVVRYHVPPEMKKYSQMMNRFQELAQAKRAAPTGFGSPAAEATQLQRHRQAAR
ncbi:hypothetical protein OROGR_010337 [Orobanche gracilis]